MLTSPISMENLNDFPVTASHICNNVYMYGQIRTSVCGRTNKPHRTLKCGLNLLNLLIEIMQACKCT